MKHKTILEAMGVGHSADQAPGGGMALRRGSYWVVFLPLLGLSGYWFWSHPALLSNDVWTHSGLSRFLIFTAVYALMSWAAYLFVVRWVPLILAVVAAPTACAAVGVAGPVAAA